jgi:hypothetical protein
LLEQRGAQRDVAILAALAVADVDHHAGAVDVLNLKVAEFRSAHTGGVEGHEDGPVAEVDGAVDESRGFLGAEYGGKFARRLGRGRSSRWKGRRRTFKYRKRSAHIRCMTVWAASLRSWNKYVSNRRISSMPSRSGER